MIAKHVIRKFNSDYQISYLKIDVGNASDDTEIYNEFRIQTRKIYSGELCPDHAEAMVLGDAIQWAKINKSDLLIVESAGLCLRCSPFLDHGLGVTVLDASSGLDRPDKMSSMIGLADIVVITKIDMISQVEREVLLQKIRDRYPNVKCIEGNALQGTSLQTLYYYIKDFKDIGNETISLKGNPPLGTCTICIGKKDIGWENHYGVVRRLDGDLAECFYRGD